MKVTVDRGVCASALACVDICPDVFEVDTDSKAVVKVDPVPTECEAACREAADQCPVGAIEITE